MIPVLTLNSKKETILESSKSLLKLLRGLSSIGDFFASPILRKEGFSDIKLDLSLSDIEQIDIIKHSILKFSEPDIKKYEKSDDVDFSYSRDFGFSLVIQFEQESRKLSFTCKIGSSSVNAIGLLSNNNFDVDLLMGDEILRNLISTGLVKQGVIKLSDLKFLKACRSYKYPLGYVTYFSNDYEIPVPDDLEGIEYEHTDNGKYLILSREDITSNPEKLEAGKQKLLDTMAEIKRRVPEYGK